MQVMTMSSNPENLNSEKEGDNPYAPTSGVEATIDPRSLFSLDYWIYCWGLFLAPLIFACFAFLRVPSYAILPGFIAMFGLLAMIRSYWCSYRVRRYRLVDARKKIEFSLPLFYASSFALGILITIASAISFCVICTPLGFAVFSIGNPFGGGPDPEFRMFVIVSSIAGLAAAFVGFLLMRATLPSIKK